MKYYQIVVDAHYIPPVPVGWYGKIDQKTVAEKKSYEMPLHLLFETESHMQMVFTDVIVFPCLMVSGIVRDVVMRYMPRTGFTRVILFDKARGCSKAYYMPHLRSAGHIKKDINGSIAVEKELLGDEAVVKMDGIDKTYIIMRMDIVESVLRRGTVGVGLKEITIV